MFKFSYKIVQGIFDDVENGPTFHVIVLRHKLYEDQPREDGEGFLCGEQTVFEGFTRYSEDMAREDAQRRVGELTSGER
jgi:hypothetical protein